MLNSVYLLYSVCDFATAGCCVQHASQCGADLPVVLPVPVLSARHFPSMSTYCPGNKKAFERLCAV